MSQTAIVQAAADQADGLSSWTNPGFITAQDGQFATNATPAGPTNTLRGTMGTRNFSIPSNATGVQVDILCKQPSGGGMVLSFARLVQGGAALGSNQAASNAVPTTLGTISIGGAGILWGNPSISSTTANSSTFGVDIQFSGSAMDSISVDDVQLTMFFAAATDSSEMIAARQCISG